MKNPTSNHQIGMMSKATSRQNVLAKTLMALSLLVLSAWPALAGTVDFKDWTASFSNSTETWTNTSDAGTVTGTSHCPGCYGAPTGTYGVATPITPQLFTTEFNSNGKAVPQSISFNFSSGYRWGAGGELFLGNIHEYYAYTISAWDFNNNPIDVNTWTTPNGLQSEYLNGAVGQMGYFSTSSTMRCRTDGTALCTSTGNSENFYVNDPNADPNSGQGGVIPLGGLQNVGRIELTLFASDLGQNAQSGDFILFNVGTPTPEPGSLFLFGSGIAGLAGFLRRRLLS